MSTAVQSIAVVHDSMESAEVAGLRYVTDDEPGIRRRRAGKGFTFLDPQGKTVKDRKVIERIKKLAIPPAWSDVWICQRANGHLQATGRDARGRKQYRYHAGWRSVRDETKFARLSSFGEALPKLRERVDQDLARRGLPREKVLAAVVNLLESTLIRVGNPEYAKQNNSFGLTTLRNRHVDISGATLRFEFRGKSGKDHSVEIQDRRLARIVRQVRDLPGQRLFQYLDADGERQSISSEDVNDYLRASTGEDFSAKDFRTWGGTVLALSALLELGPCETEKEASRAVVEAVKQVSALLGNRPATCRKFYVHPLVLESYLEGSLTQGLTTATGGPPDEEDPTGLRRLEGQVLRLLQMEKRSVDGRYSGSGESPAASRTTRASRSR